MQVNDKLTVHYAAGQRHLALPTRSMVDVLEAKKIARAFRPDVVHGQGTDTHGDVAIRLGYPSVVTIHGVGSFETELREKGRPILGPLRVRLTKSMIQRVTQRAGVVISISEFDRKFCSGLRHGPVVKIPNAVRAEFFETAPTFPDSKRVLFTGLVIERKNVVGLVRAFEKVKQCVPEAVLDIAGPRPDEGYYGEVLRNIDVSLRNSIVFHGNVGAKQLLDLMQQASVAVLFSIYENLPVAIAEALSAGKPVVCSRVGGVEEMVDDGVNGFLVPSHDEDALADRIVILLRDESLRKEMGTKGSVLARERWFPARVVEETIKAYRIARDELDSNNAS